MKTAAKQQAVSTKRMALIGVMAAATCIVAPFSIPIPVSPVPLSLTTLVLYTAVYVLGTKDAFFSYVTYLLLGFAGLPVFSGFAGGAAKLAGPTGGYLIGFLFMIPLTGSQRWRVERLSAICLGRCGCACSWSLILRAGWRRA